MANNKTDKKFEKMIREIKQDENVLAFWLDGSRGKGIVITKNSDYDGVMVVKDDALKKYKKKYAGKKNNLDIRVRTLAEMEEHAKPGTEMAWDRYNFVRLKVMFDRTGKMQKILDKKPKMSNKEQKMVIERALDDFLNQLYRAEKDKRDGNILAAKMDALEAIPFFIEAIFALEGKVRPYNKYLAFELDNYPLKKFPWKKGELVKIFLDIIENGRLDLVYKLLLTIRPIFKKHGFKKVFDGWRGYYKVGE